LNDTIVIFCRRVRWRATVLRETDPQTMIWRALFSARLGRPSVPIDTLLRLLYLKHRYGLGYESLCRCRIRPPWSSWCAALAPEVIEELNAALLGNLAGDKLLRAPKLRVDTTVVEADIDTRPTRICWSTRSESLTCGGAEGS
jgi:hypothetical protein